jgi:hypothetical protein
MVSSSGAPDIFVEVKHPGWQGERKRWRTVDMQRLSPQAKQQLNQDKYLDEDGGPVSPHVPAMDVVRRNALPKFTVRCPNLVVVVDDLHVTPVGLPCLDDLVKREFSNPDYDLDDPQDVLTYERLGGVLFLHPVPESHSRTIRYGTDFVENPCALPDCALPPTAKTALAQMRDGSRLRSKTDSSRGPLSRRS